MNDVGDDDFGREAWDDGGKKDSRFGDGRAYEVEGCGEDDDIEDVVDEAWESSGCG